MIEYWCHKCGKQQPRQGMVPRPCYNCGCKYLNITEPKFKVVPDEPVKGTSHVSDSIYKFSINPFGALETKPDKYDWLRANYKDN